VMLERIQMRKCEDDLDEVHQYVSLNW